jgi:hypothetical protein
MRWNLTGTNIKSFEESARKITVGKKRSMRAVGEPQPE